VLGILDDHHGCAGIQCTCRRPPPTPGCPRRSKNAAAPALLTDNGSRYGRGKPEGSPAQSSTIGRFYSPYQNGKQEAFWGTPEAG
jgi:hypothetical protein